MKEDEARQERCIPEQTEGMKGQAGELIINLTTTPDEPISVPTDPSKCLEEALRMLAVIAQIQKQGIIFHK